MAETLVLVASSGMLSFACVMMILVVLEDRPRKPVNFAFAAMFAALALSAGFLCFSIIMEALA